ncbi:hypothetical protein [Paenibacillus chitinolyticus]|uniref:hypothetical protein n=1 Tax=Paenibacillus chitinolyticus TaxID=79263 RepID=UPI003D036B7F
MATPLSSVTEIIETLKSVEVNYANADIPIKHAKLGVTQASIALDTDWGILGTDISADLTTKEIYLCGLFAFRNFAFQDHHGLTQKAVNFKTINFAVTGLTERAKEAMRIVWWLDNEIAKTLASLGGIPMGSASEMGNSTKDTTI